MQVARQNHLVWVLGVVVAVVALLALWQMTQAQVEVPAVPNPPVVAAQPGQPMPPPPGFGQPAPGQPFPGQPLPGIGERLAIGQVAVAANNEYVYVVRGNMLYQFSAKDLKLLNSAELPRPQIRRTVPGAEGQPQTQPRLRRRLQEQGQPPAQP